jgi:hypothetical protein
MERRKEDRRVKDVVTEVHSRRIESGGRGGGSCSWGLRCGEVDPRLAPTKFPFLGLSSILLAVQIKTPQRFPVQVYYL